MQVRVFRVGPLGPGQFLYVPVPAESGQLRPEHLVPAGDDRAGLSALRAKLPQAELVCAPELGEAAQELGLASAELEQPQRELRADVALAVAGGEARLPPTTPLEARRMFLRGLGIFSNSPGWEHACLTGARLSAELEGTLQGQPCAWTVALQAAPTSLALDLARGEAIEELSLNLVPTPGFAVADLSAAYRLGARPEFARGTPDAERYTVLGAAFLALAAISPDVEERELEVHNGLAVQLTVRARLHALP